MRQCGTAAPNSQDSTALKAAHQPWNWRNQHLTISKNLVDKAMVQEGDKISKEYFFFPLCMRGMLMLMQFLPWRSTGRLEKPFPWTQGKERKSSPYSKNLICLKVWKGYRNVGRNMRSRGRRRKKIMKQEREKDTYNLKSPVYTLFIEKLFLLLIMYFLHIPVSFSTLRHPFGDGEPKLPMLLKPQVHRMFLKCSLLCSVVLSK